jgi:hypothetical protein
VVFDVERIAAGPEAARFFRHRFAHLSPPPLRDANPRDV